MLIRLVVAALNARAAVVVATLVFAAFGVWAFLGVTIEAFPDPTDTQVNVITQASGQPAEEMERQISVPIERAVNGMPGLARVRSINLFGLSFVTLTFKDGVDVMAARAQTLERLRSADLPEGVVPELGSLSTPIGEIYRYTLLSPKRDPLELRTLQDWVVRPRLLQVDGVADVVSYGGLVREFQVRPDPTKLAANKLTLADVERVLHQGSENASGGILARGHEQLVIRSEGLFKTAEDVADVTVVTRGGTPVRLADVASVREGWTPRQGVVSRDDDFEAVEGIVIMRRGENPTAVLERVRDKIQEIGARHLPPGTRIDPFYDRTELVSSTLKTVGRNLLEGALLVTFVLFVFLVDLKAALIVGAVIPLSLLAAFAYLNARGMSANLISMGSVDFGIIVDGAVVIVEAIVARLGAHPGHDPEAELGPREKIERAVRDVARPTVFALLIIIAAYLPIFLLQRVEGRIFAPLAHTVVAALVGSLVFSVTLVPVLATVAYRSPKPHRESPVLVLFSKAYGPTLRAALRWPLLVLALATAALGGSGWLLARRGTEFLPELNEGALYVTFSLPPNTSLDQGRKFVPPLSHVLEGFPQVQQFTSQLGRPEDGTDPALANNLEFFVKLRPMAEWPKETPTLGALVDAMSRAFAVVPGLEVNFSQPVRDNVNENISGQKGQIALKIYGDDPALLRDAAEKAKLAVADVPGAADVGLVKSGDVPQLHVVPSRAQLGRFGLTMDDFQSALAVALGGRKASELWERDRVFPIVLRLPDVAREDPEAVAALRVPTPSGGLVPLGSLASVDVDLGPAAINRENGQRYVGVRMNVRGRDLGTFVDDARRAVDAAVPLGPGMYVEWGGEFESKERAMRRLGLVLPVAIAITLGLLYQSFRSIGLAFLVLCHVPFALVGGAIGLALFGMPVSIAAAVGFIALIGQASLNGVLVVSAIEERIQAGLELVPAILEGTAARLRAVLMTAALAALGLVPAAVSKAMGAETQRPIAVVVVGGTLSAAVLTLVVLPVSYLLARRLLVRLGVRVVPAVVES